MALLQIQEPIPQLENKDSEALVVGIDLGTTNSLIGIYENEKLTIFCDENGDDMIASKVAYNEAGEVVGVGKNAVGIGVKTKEIKSINEGFYG